ncbi:MAG: tyrosine-type recombinase/integrase [Sedimentisphaerales bacterium]|nr:tyrosine-type recombinase/integrase [Sedimentisphaerales bacterium]
MDQYGILLADELAIALAILKLAAGHSCPYVFLPESRYKHIQRRRGEGLWTLQHGICPLNNFTPRFKTIRRKANIAHGTFHDLRRTYLTRWLQNRLGEYEVMHLAGHSDFQTTHRFYLAVQTDLVERARRASSMSFAQNFVANLLQQSNSSDLKKIYSFTST